MLRFTQQNRTGFTLIELLVTLAIITILLAMSMAAISNARVRSRDAKRIADLRTIQSALEQHYLGEPTHNYPPDPSISSLNNQTYCVKYDPGTTPTTSAGTQKGIYDNKCFGEYLSVVPKNTNDQQYEYNKPGCFTAISITTGDKSGVDLTNTDTPASCDVKFSASYGLHVALETDKNQESAQDASPSQKFSYDLVP